MCGDKYADSDYTPEDIEVSEVGEPEAGGDQPEASGTKLSAKGSSIIGSAH